MAKRGRPTKYKDEFAEQARKLCVLGATDADLADFFNVTEQTINNWKNDHEGFFESLKVGKDYSDSLVVQALFKRATGYSHPEDKIFNHAGEPLVVPTEKHYPPDATSCIYWLNNRQPDLWRGRREPEGDTNDLVSLFAELVNKLPD